MKSGIGFVANGLSHRRDVSTGKLRASVTALRQDVQMLLQECPDLDGMLRRVFERDLRRSHEVLQEEDGRHGSYGKCGEETRGCA